MDFLTASRMGAFLACPRKHYWAYEVGLKPVAEANALRFGTAWHAALEALALGKELADAFDIATEGKEFDEVTLATLSAMLGGWANFPKARFEAVVASELEFHLPLTSSKRFALAGKLDLLAKVEGRLCLVENKTTSDSVEPGSTYWERLRMNPQILQYVDAARRLGYEIQSIYYAVAKKPGIKPKEIPQLDADGFKVVIDNSTGERVMLGSGKPRQAAFDDTQTLVSRTETAEEYGARLAADIAARPEFYFAVREVPVLDQELDEFLSSRTQIARMILDRRRAQKTSGRPENAWPRNIAKMACGTCPFVNFCLQCVEVNIPNQLPSGFRLGDKHEELTQTEENAQ